MNIYEKEAPADWYNELHYWSGPLVKALQSKNTIQRLIIALVNTEESSLILSANIITYMIIVITIRTILVLHKLA